MRILVESLKRLYAKGQVTKEKIEEMVTKGTIQPEEKLYILGEAMEA